MTPPGVIGHEGRRRGRSGLSRGRSAHRRANLAPLGILAALRALSRLLPDPRHAVRTLTIGVIATLALLAAGLERPAAVVGLVYVLVGCVGAIASRALPTRSTTTSRR